MTDLIKDRDLVCIHTKDGTDKTVAFYQDEFIVVNKFLNVTEEPIDKSTIDSVLVFTRAGFKWVKVDEFYGLYDTVKAAS